MDKTFNINAFELFNNQWALVTAGPIDKHNSMTVSWGELGTLWGKPVVTIYIKPARYTHEFIEENEHFVVSFFKEDYRKPLGIMGSFSGRDNDKDKMSGLTPVEHDGLTIYQEAEVTLICRKIYQNDLNPNRIPEEELNRHYKEQAPHTMYIGEVVDIIRK